MELLLAKFFITPQTYQTKNFAWQEKEQWHAIPSVEVEIESESNGQIFPFLYFSCVFIGCCHAMRQAGPLMIYFCILLSTAILFAPLSKRLLKVPWGAITEQHE